MVKARGNGLWIRQEIRLTPGFRRDRGQQRVGNQPAAHFQFRRKPADFGDVPDPFRVDTATAEQNMKTILRMAPDCDIYQGAAIGRLPCGGCLGQRLPMRAPHGVIQSGQNDGAVGQLRHGGNEPGGRGPGSGRSCNDDRAVGRRCGQASGEDVEHRIVMTGRAGAVDFLKQRRPVLARDLEKLRCQLPPLLQIRGRDIVEAGEITFFGLDRLDQVGQGAAQPDGVGRVGGGDQRHAAEMIPDFCGKARFQARTRSARRSVAAIGGIGGSSANVSGSAESKNPASSSVSPRGRIDGRIADPLPMRSVSSERSTRAARRVGTNTVAPANDNGSSGL
jgi:hypothetical protein